MKRKKAATRICLLLAAAIAALVLLRLSFRTITVVSGEEFVDRCPRYARPGQEVAVLTAVVSDGDIDVSGAEGDFVRPGVFVFTMPDTDVRIRVSVTVFPDGA